VRPAAGEPPGPRTALDDRQALLLRDPRHPPDLYAAPGAPWRLATVPSDAQWAARMLLPFGTRLAAGTLRAPARTQQPGTGLIPGPPRDTGPHLPPVTGAVEAASLFVTVLAAAWRRGLPAREAEPLLPAAERCLGSLRGAAAASGAGGLVADPVRDGPLRAEVQAYVHRAAVQGADLLEAFGRPGAAEWRERAAGTRAGPRDRGGGGRARPGRHADAAAALLAGVMDAAAGFGMRLPEIYAGEKRRAAGSHAPTRWPAVRRRSPRPASSTSWRDWPGCGRTCRAAPSR